MCRAYLSVAESCFAREGQKRMIDSENIEELEEQPETGCIVYEEIHNELGEAHG